MIKIILSNIKLNKKKYFHRGLLGLWILATLATICIVFVTQFSWGNGFKIRSEISTKVDHYYYSWIKFQSMSGKDIHRLWNDRYHDSIYELDGNEKYNKFDCISAFHYALKGLGSNFPLLPVDELYAWLLQMSTPRPNFYSIRSKDIIIFRSVIGGTAYWHIGWIEGITPKGYIKYMDMNVLTNADYKMIVYGHPTIKGIFPITFKAWIGELLTGVKEI